MKRLYEMLQKVDAKVAQFYCTAIELHENENLRSLAGSPIKIVKSSYGNSLDYTSNGFRVIATECIESGDMYSGGRYRHHQHLFEKSEGKLYAKTYKGRKELLDLFPSLTLTGLEAKLVEGIEESALYRGE
jgi:hypothetical protein